MKKESTRLRPTNKNDQLAIFCAVVLFVVILFSLPPLVGGVPPNKIDTVHCNGHGLIDELDGNCICYSGFFGLTCDKKFCPFGPSWLQLPLVNQQRYRPNTECSDVGLCEYATGLCKCPDGYEGRACERIKCPSSSSLGAGAKTGTSAFPPCSGHGLCRTLGYMASHFDGLRMIHPPITYTNWEAESLQGCMCDHGYDGYDCSKRACPWGPDPQSPIAATYSTYTLNCQASSGYFTMQVLGEWTQPIPYDADVELLESILEALLLVDSVTVTIPVVSGAATVCASSIVQTTTIQFNDYIGPRPPIMVSLKTAASRMWPDSNNVLARAGGAAVTLEMKSIYTLTCPACAAPCTGSIMFTYEDQVSSSALGVTTNGAGALIVTMIQSIGLFYSNGWGITSITTSGGNGALCASGAATTITISMTSNYGNLPSLGVIGSVKANGVPITVTLTDTNGKGTLHECSNQGICDRATGTCICTQGFSITEGNIVYRALSSDGNGGIGTKGDCGYVATPVSNSLTCNLNGENICNGHGLCDPTNVGCACYEGYSGLSCESKSCPYGPAWIDEPIGSTKAHAEAECSNMGVCDHTSGRCLCNVGYVGTACQYRDCPDRDAITGSPCNGNGWCMTMRQLAATVGVSYGSQNYVEPTDGSTWDADSWYQCLCSADVPSGFIGNPQFPTVTPRAMISGYLSVGVSLPGYRGLTCKHRNCPVGDTTNGRNPVGGNFGGVVEIQKVSCSLPANGYFWLSFKGQVTAKIYATDLAKDIKQKLEELLTIGNVSIGFPQTERNIPSSIAHYAKACSSLFNSTFGGFTVTFESDYGTVPLLVATYPNSFGAQKVLISEIQMGTRLSLECGGSDMGTCNRVTGDCECYAPYTSSNGSLYSPGIRGDCAYYSHFADNPSYQSPLTTGKFTGKS